MYKKMQENYPMEIDLVEPRKEWRNQALIDASFNAHHKLRFDLKLFSKSEWVRCILLPAFWKYFLTTFKLKESVRAALVHQQLKPLQQQADVICFHNLTSSILELLQYIPVHKKIILSFWGSDLYRNNDSYKLTTQQAAIERAKHIVVHNNEMKVIALSKFGWQYENKISTLLSTDFSETLQSFIDNRKHNASYLKAFKEKHQIPEQHCVVVVGHSAHDIDNHLFIIPQLACLDKEILKHCSFVFPMTYGNEGDYLTTVKKACNAAGINHIIISEFMQNEEVVALRHASEILIRLSKFDAFSLSLCETLAAGNIVIAATWLPYGNLRTFDVFYKEVNAFDRLPEIFTDVLQHKNKYLALSENNGSKILDFYHAQKSIEQLAKIYMS